MTREIDYDNTANTVILIPFEKSLVNKGKSTVTTGVETHAEDILNFNSGREGLCLNGSSSFRIPYNPVTTLNWHSTWSVCFWVKHDSEIDIDTFPQILFNTFEQTSPTTTQTLTCQYTSDYKIRFSANSTNRDSEAIDLDLWHFVVLIHVPNSKFRIFIDGRDQTGTYSNDGRLSTAIVESNNDIVFFKKYDNTNRSSKAIKFYGFRFYQKELSTQEINTLLGISNQSTEHTDDEYDQYLKRTQVEAKSLPSTFGGNVVKITKGLASKRVIVHNYIHRLVNIVSLKSYVRTTLFNIIRRELEYEDKFDFILLGRFRDFYIKNATLSGSIHDLIVQYMSRSNNRFYINAANQLVFQSNDLFNSKYVFTHGKDSIITDTTEDSTSIFNEIVTTEDGETYEFVRTHTYSWGVWNSIDIYIRDSEFIKKVTVRSIGTSTSSEEFTAFPFTSSVTVGSHVLTYTGTISNDLLLFRVSISPTITSEIVHSFALDIEYSIPTLRERRDENQRSIMRHGTRSKIIHKESIGNIPYQDVVTSELSRGNLRLNYKVIAPQLIKDIRVGDYVVINNSLKNIDNVSVQVRKIEWMYPEGQTILHCGDTEYDIYSTYAQIGESIKNIINVNPSNVPIVRGDIDPNNLIDGE